MSRLRSCLAVGTLVAVGESAAAVLLGIWEPAFHVHQAGIALLMGLALAAAPLPARLLPLVPLVCVGWLHVFRIGLSGTGLVSVSGLALSAAHIALVCAFVGKALGRGRPIVVFAAAYGVQALWCAALLFPMQMATGGSPAWTSLLCASLAPAAAAAAASRLAGRKISSRLWPAVALGALAVAPPALHWPWTFATHRRMEPPAAVPRTELPDVVHIVLDTARADRMSVYGHDRPTTPNLEAFARSATVFENATSQGTWTLPGHASMFTGLYLGEHLADNIGSKGGNPLPPSALTLAERFRSAGYATACVAANSGMFGQHFGLTQGFSTLWSEPGLQTCLPLPWLARTVVHTLRGHSARQRMGPLERGEFPTAHEITEAAVRWLDRNTDRPRYLFLNYMEAHGQLRREPCGAPLFGSGQAYGEWDVPNYKEVLADQEDPDPAELTKLSDWYDSQMACLDLHLAELFLDLEQRGLMEDAIVVVTSDHGQMLGEHRSFHHKSEIWEGLLHVPLIIKMPGQTAGQRCDEVVETADLAGFLPAAAGIEPGPRAFGATAPCPLPGRNDTAVIDTRRSWDLARDWPERWARDYVMIREGSLKYVLDTRGERFVIDLGADPAESPRPPTEAESARLDALLADWRAGLAPPLDLPDLSDAERQARLEALRGLGYVDSGD